MVCGVQMESKSFAHKSCVFTGGLLQVVDRTALKRLASAVRFRPWPPCFQLVTASQNPKFVPFCSNSTIQARRSVPHIWRQSGIRRRRGASIEINGIDYVPLPFKQKGRGFESRPAHQNSLGINTRFSAALSRSPRIRLISDGFWHTVGTQDK